MLFNSYVFVFLFWPLSIIGYWVINRCFTYKIAQMFLIIVSVWFYSYLNWKQLPALVFNILINYILFRILQNKKEGIIRKSVLIVSLVFNVGTLCYYKYFDFFVENVNSLFNRDSVFSKVVLPVGISYVIFQQIAFLVDTYRKETKEYELREYILFILFFPKIISGPIVLHDEFLPQLQDEKRQKLDWDNIASGFYLFSLGLAKKVLLADTFGKAVDYAYGIATKNGVRELYALDWLIIIFSYSLQLYFDFSGYSDMAIGISKTFNIELPINFNSPYKALSITEFWKRWHMTLTRFLTKYVYIPLGGNRKGRIRTYINIMIVFAISGLWHGTGWTFLVWGIMHGIFQVIERMFPLFFKKLHPVLSWLITFGLVSVAWVFFRADTVSQATDILLQTARMSFASINDGIVEAFNLPEYVWLSKNVLPINVLIHYPCFYLFLFLIIGFVAILGNSNSIEKTISFKPSAKNVIIVCLLMVYCIFSFSGVSTFLYWEF